MKKITMAVLVLGVLIGVSGCDDWRETATEKEISHVEKFRHVMSERMVSGTILKFKDGTYGVVKVYPDSFKVTTHFAMSCVGGSITGLPLEQRSDKWVDSITNIYLPNMPSYAQGSSAFLAQQL